MSAQQILESDNAFEVILCDLMMPEMTGMQLHEWLVTRHPELSARVVFITGGIFTPKAAEYLAAVDNLQVQKPFDVSELRELVAGLCDDPVDGG